MHGNWVRFFRTAWKKWSPRRRLRTLAATGCQVKCHMSSNSSKAFGEHMGLLRFITVRLP